MMQKIKQWLFVRFLPAYVNESMRERIQSLESENDRLRAYIRGMEMSMRLQRKIQIRNEVAGHGIDGGTTTSK